MKIKAMPGTPMTDEEMESQMRFVSEAAEAMEYFTEDELEESLRRGSNVSSLCGLGW